jgi:hypothetical protein
MVSSPRAPENYLIRKFPTFPSFPGPRALQFSKTNSRAAFRVLGPFLCLLWRPNLRFHVIDCFSVKNKFNLTQSPLKWFQAVSRHTRHKNQHFKHNFSQKRFDFATITASCTQTRPLSSTARSKLCCWGYPQPVCPESVRPHRCASSVSTLPLRVRSRGRAPARPMGFPPPLVPHINSRFDSLYPRVWDRVVEYPL